MPIEPVPSINSFLRRIPTWPVYLVGGLIPVWYLYAGLTGRLGFDPVKEMEHALGLLSLQVLIVVLAITPIRKVVGINLVKFRRALGLLVFYFVLCHFLVWFILDVQFVEEVWNDIIKRPYITIGMAALLIMVPLAVTSSNAAIRKIGPLAWRRLHMATYAVAIMGGIHFVMASKIWDYEPMIYLGLIFVLLAMRIRIPKRLRAPA